MLSMITGDKEKLQKKNLSLVGVIDMLILKTVGELKDFIKDLPDDVPTLLYQSGKEQQGYRSYIGVRAENMISEKKHFLSRETYDVFDYTRHTHEVFSPTHDDTGVFCLILG